MPRTLKALIHLLPRFRALGLLSTCAGPRKTLSYAARNQSFPRRLVIVPVVMIVVVAVPIVPTVLAPNVMAVDPMVMVLRPVTSDPDHFVVALPIPGAMVVIRPVTYLNV
jgi:hypothetical protein